MTSGVRANRLVAAFIVSLSCALLAASCAQPAPGTSETNCTGCGAAGIAFTDESNSDDVIVNGSEPPASSATSEPSAGAWSDPGASPAEPEGCFKYRLCVLLRRGPASARVAFCVSQPESDVRRRCFSHVYARHLG
jgi:hypothetical protein